MGLLDSITAWFKRESADVKDAVDDLQRDLDLDLSRKERELTASPEERMDMLQDEIDDSQSGFDAIRDKIESTSAHADAVEEIRVAADSDEADDG